MKFLSVWSKCETRNKADIIVCVFLLCAATVPKSKCHTLANPCESVPQLATFEDKVCPTMHINKEEQLVDLCRCHVIDGSLTISGFESWNNATFMKSFSFFNLKEITHFLRIYRLSHIETLETWLPNLSVIRGQILNGKYALIIYYMPQLRYLGLSNLTSIMRGSFYFIRCQKLCFWNTIEWNSITEGNIQNPNEMVILGKNLKLNGNRDCYSCPSNCTGDNCTSGCWGPNPKKHCQKVCEEKCIGGCIGADCCHKVCVGGCSRSHDPTACVACRNLRFNGTCVDRCPSTLFQISRHRCATKEQCISKRYLILEDKRECVRPFCPGMKKSCLQPCPAGYAMRLNRSVCYKCKNPSACPKECPVYHPGFISFLGQADMYFGCTILKGSLKFQEFKGGVKDVEKELLRIFKDLEVIKGSFELYQSNFTSLSFLPKLKIITGNILLRGKFVIIVEDNPLLESLWSQPMQIGGGAVFFQANPSLCTTRIYQFLQIVNNYTNSNESYISPKSNGDDIFCRKQSVRALIKTTDQYGTVILKTQLISRFFPDSIYYVFYKKTEEAISLKDIKHNCKYDGLKMKEIHFVSSELSREVRFQKKISELDPFSKYAFYVKIISLSTEEEGGESDVVYGSTSEFNPSEPRGLRGISDSPSTLNLRWDPPQWPNGEIHHYLVVIEQQKERLNLGEDMDYCKWTQKHPKISCRKMSKIINSATRKEEAEGKEWRDMKRKEKSLERDKTCREAFPSFCCQCKSSQGLAASLHVFQGLEKDNFLLRKDAYAKRVSNEKLKLQKATLEYLHFLAPLLCKEKSIANLLLTYKSRLEGSDVSHFSNSSAEIICNNVLQSRLASKSLVTLLLDQIALGDSSSLNGLKEVLRSRNQGGIARSPFLLSIEDAVANADEMQAVKGLYRLSAHSSPVFSEEGDLVKAELSINLTTFEIRSLRPSQLYTVEVYACLKPARSIMPTFSFEGGQLLVLNSFKQELCSSVPASRVFKTKYDALENVVSAESITTEVQRNSAEISVGWQPSGVFEGTRENMAFFVEHKNLITEDVGTTCISIKEFESTGRRILLQNLTPGNYSINVKVLARGVLGPPSDEKFISVEKRMEAFSTYQAYVITLTVAIIFVLLCLCLLRKKYLEETVDLSSYVKKEFIIKKNKVKIDFDNPLGKGNFGEVFKGVMRQEGKDIEVAIKMPVVKSYSDNDSFFKKFLKEAQHMYECVDSAYVVKTLGVLKYGNKICCVMEFMEKGDLKTFLEEKRDKRALFSLPTILQWALEAADGMTYIASKKLVHRDLSARNCLLSRQLILKIGDFGLSRDLKEDYLTKTERDNLPIRWMAPESIEHGTASTESDIWSFGVFLWEIVSMGALPYSELSNDEIREHVVGKKYILSCPPECHSALYQIMKDCWKTDPSERKHFAEIAQQLLCIYLESPTNACHCWVSVFNENSFLIKNNNFEPIFLSKIYNLNSQGRCGDNDALFCRENTIGNAVSGSSGIELSAHIDIESPNPQNNSCLVRHQEFVSPNANAIRLFCSDCQNAYSNTGYDKRHSSKILVTPCNNVPEFSSVIPDDVNRRLLQESSSVIRVITSHKPHVRTRPSPNRLNWQDRSLSSSQHSHQVVQPFLLRNDRPEKSRIERKREQGFILMSPPSSRHKKEYFSPEKFKALILRHVANDYK